MLSNRSQAHHFQHTKTTFGFNTSHIYLYSFWDAMSWMVEEHTGWYAGTYMRAHTSSPLCVISADSPSCFVSCRFLLLCEHCAHRGIISVYFALNDCCISRFFQKIVIRIIYKKEGEINHSARHMFIQPCHDSTFKYTTVYWTASNGEASIPAAIYNWSRCTKQKQAEKLAETRMIKRRSYF